MTEQGTSPQETGPLSGVRVLDLTTPLGGYCTKLLADLGAEVVRVESPHGDPSRERGPFYHDQKGPDRSLSFFYMNTSKRSITLDLTTSQGQELFRRLVAQRDIVVESFEFGYMESLGLGYTSLRELNPGLIYTAVTPFGQTGPYRFYKGTDIVGVAMGGLMYLGGDPASPPSQPGSEQGYFQAGTVAAAGTLQALYLRDLVGQGQLVDVSMQDAVAFCMENAIPFWELTDYLRTRLGVLHFDGSGLCFACKDGWVVGGATARWEAFSQWLDEEGWLTQEWRDPAWHDPEHRLTHRDELTRLTASFFSGMTKQEIYEKSQARGLLIAPVNSIEEALREIASYDPAYLVPVEHTELGEELLYPGAPFYMEATPWRISRRPPLTGEHNREVYGEEMGLSLVELEALERDGVI